MYKKKRKGQVRGDELHPHIRGKKSAFVKVT